VTTGLDPADLRPDVSPYDALLLVSFGGPEQAADVLPFLENVTKGRGVPPERLTEVAEHYYELGGRSPLNDQNRELLAAVRADLEAAGMDMPVYWGNRNWAPYLAETLQQMTRDGVQRAACFVTSAYASYSGCRQYRENLWDAVAGAGAAAPRLDKLRHYFNHPGFVEPFTEATHAAIASLPDAVREQAELVFVTHSIPVAMNASAGPDGGAYSEQHLDVAAEIAAACAARTGVQRSHQLAFCSRSGPPQVPWLEPDVNDVLRDLAAAGVPAVVVVPIGFVSDHMEVRYDLDTEAAATAAEVGLAFARASTPGTDERFVAMVRELLIERAAVERRPASGPDVLRPVGGALAPSWDVCPAGCCSNAREPQRPALCGRDSTDPRTVPA
jgi:ferrochelatase